MPALQFLKAPCGCIIDCPSKAILLVTEPTEEHMAQHREYEAGIIHPWMEGIQMIPVEKLVINPKLLQ